MYLKIASRSVFGGHRHWIWALPIVHWNYLLYSTQSKFQTGSETWLLNTRAVRSYYFNWHRHRLLRCVFPKVQSQCSSSVATPFFSEHVASCSENLKIFQQPEGCFGTLDVQKKFSWPRITVLKCSSLIFGSRGRQSGLWDPPTAAGPNVQVPNIWIWKQPNNG